MSSHMAKELRCGNIVDALTRAVRILAGLLLWTLLDTYMLKKACSDLRLGHSTYPLLRLSHLLLLVLLVSNRARSYPALV